MARINLSELSWTLQGWRPFAWRLGKGTETAAPIAADLEPMPARIPASVQQLLLEAKLISDWNVGMNSLSCEWVEHRHWDFSAHINAGMINTTGRIALNAPGLDYSGWILVDGREAGRFEGALLPHSFDLTEKLGDGKAHLLSLVFEEPPREQGQMGYTSLSRYFKPRYPYSWDWCPRIVPIGPWKPVYLLTEADAVCKILSVRAALREDRTHGDASVQLWCEETGNIRRFQVELRRDDTLIKSLQCPAKAGDNSIDISGVAVEPWWPNGMGKPCLYDLHIAALDENRCIVWREHRRLGFRHIEWRHCENTPEDADPWLCAVNGIPLFLQGANWVPPKAVYHDLVRDDYARLISLYQNMGANLLRVWGGGILETSDFYDLCDEAGILVWQELPLSSSGVENCPPDDPAVIAVLRRIAESYALQRGHHASLLLWSGGNELTWGGPDEKTGILPVNEKHPCMAALREVFAACDPKRRFIASSPTGPRFYAQPDEYGRGLHHDIHGPWGLSSFKGVTFEEKMEAWRAYWQPDDSLFRSEVGMPGAASRECIARYADQDHVWPPTGRYWMHVSAWWTQWEVCRSSMEGIANATEGLDAYIQETQTRQAEAYSIAAQACKNRFPRCGGFIIWMGHDCFPCPANNSVIDFLGLPKPAYFALQSVFTGQEPSA